MNQTETMTKVLRLILRVSILFILIITYLYVTRGIAITTLNQVSFCKLDRKLILQSNESTKYISKVSEENSNDTLKLIVFTKTVSVFQSDDEYQFEVNIKTEIKFVQVLDSTMEFEAIEKCIE